MKASITKQLSEGEMIVIEVDAKNPEELGARLTLTWPVLEKRLLDLNDRVQTIHPLVKDLPPEIKQAIHAGLGILFGKTGSVEQMGMVMEEAKRKEADYLRLKAAYEPEPASTLAEGPAEAAAPGAESDEIEDLEVEEQEPANG